MLFPLAGLDPARAAEYYDDAGARRSPRLRRQRGGAAVPQRRDRRAKTPRRGWRRYALKPRAARRAARAVLRPVPQLRDQLQPRQGPRSARYVEARGGTPTTRRAAGRSSARCCRRRACRRASSPESSGRLLSDARQRRRSPRRDAVAPEEGLAYCTLTKLTARVPGGRRRRSARRPKDARSGGPQDAGARAKRTRARSSR